MTTDARSARLRRTVNACAWWLAVQGALWLLLGDRLAAWLGLRWVPVMAPYVRIGGLSLLVLGLFVHRAVDQPQRQALAVDALLLMLLGRVLLTLSQQVSATGYVTGVEWLIAAVDLGLGLGLLLWRTRSSEMPEAAPLHSANAGLLLRQTGRWIAGQGPKPEAGLGGFEAGPASPVQTPAPVQALWPDGSAPLMPQGQSRAAVASPLAPPPPSAASAGSPEESRTALARATTVIPELPPTEPEKPRAQPVVPPAPPREAKAAPVPPPSPGPAPRSEAIPRLE